MNTIRETVDSFRSRLIATELLAGENFDKIFADETAFKSLQKQNVILLHYVEDLENRSRRANLRIVNVPENSEGDEDGVSNMLMEVMGSKVFHAPPALEISHRVGIKPDKAGKCP